VSLDEVFFRLVVGLINRRDLLGGGFITLLLVGSVVIFAFD
jgi:hypothetical protein